MVVVAAVVAGMEGNKEREEMNESNREEDAVKEVDEAARVAVMNW